jgi:hypothetical protein
VNVALTLAQLQHFDSRTEGNGLAAVVVRCVASVYLSLQFAPCTDRSLLGLGRTCAFDAGGFVRT